MEATNDDPRKDKPGHEKAFGLKQEESKPEGEFLLGRSHRESLPRSENSSWSNRSREAGLDEEDASFGDCTVASQPSLQSSTKRFIKREESMMSHHLRGRARSESNGQDEYEISRNSEGDETQRGEVSPFEEVSDEVSGEETVIETSCDEASFNTSIYSYKETGSSSELSVDPVVWKKFKFLSSILKETQHNLRAMDDLILEHHRLHNQPTALPQPPHTLCQGLGEGEPKTDEAKLEEILSLLHHLTHTLSSYEQHPLLASPSHHQVVSASLHPDAAAHQQASVALCHPSSTEVLPHTSHSHLLSTNQPLSPSKDAKFSESFESKNVSFTTSEIHKTGVFAREDGAYSGFSSSFHDSTPDGRLLQEPYQEAPRDRHSHTSPYYPSVKRNVDHVSSLPGISEPQRVHKKDTVSQTDPFLLVPRVSEEHPPPHDAFSCQIYQPEGLQGQQEVLHHPLMKETRSLRKDIDDIMARKQALDSRLQSLIAHRAMQRELEATDFDEPRRRLAPLTKSKSLEDGELRRSKSKHRKYKSRSKSCEEESHIKRKNSSPRESYLSMINENQDEFPSLTMESLDNEDKITDLQTDEADIPGLGDSGLSSEINSINATIQELVRENQQLHKFLQGMTCESMLKVDQEKLALEAQIQSLDQENQSLKISLDEEQDFARSRIKVSKGVKFCINEENEEAEDSDKERGEIKRSKSKERDEHDSTSEVLTVSTKTESAAQRTAESGSDSLSTAREGEEEASQFSDHQAEITNHLRAEIDRLTKQNQQLVNIIEKERSAASSHRDSPKALKNQSTDEGVDFSSVGECMTNHSSSMREVEKLQQKIKKLTEEREILEFKLSREASERDFESTRLEARIQILSDQNQTLSQKLQGSSSGLSKTEKAETSCQTDTSSLLKSETLIPERQREAESSTEESKVCTRALGQTSTAQHSYSCPDKVMSTSASTVLPPNLALSSITLRRTEEHPEPGSGKHRVPPVPEDLRSSHPHLKDVPLSMLSSDENISTDDDKISLIKTPREDTHLSDIPNAGMEESHTPPDNIHSTGDVLGKKGIPVIESVTHDKESKQGAPVQQLEALVAQNKAIASSLSELKSFTKASESNRESAFIRIMEENVRVMQNIGEKLASAGLSSTSTEPDARLPRLSQENQELKTTLQEQQKRIETLINQNSSLEKKLQVAQPKKKEGWADDVRSLSSGSPQIPDNAALNMMETKGKKREKVSEEVLSDVSMGSLLSEKQEDSMETSRVSVIERKQSLKPVSRGQALSSGCAGEASSSAPADQALSPAQAGESRAGSLSPDQTGRGRSQQDSYQHSGSNESSRKESAESQNALSRETKKSSAVLDPETQRLLDAALRKEEEARTHLLEEAEREKAALQERIVMLVRENDCLAARLQEVVNVSRNLSGHVHSVKDQLVRVEAEKDDLHRKVRSLENGQEDSSLSLSDSIGSSRLTQRLKERIRSLQGEVEQGWQEAHQRVVERDKAVAEKESLEYTSSIAINTARKEAESLREQLVSLQEERDRRSLEQTNLQNELERKLVMAKAAQESQANHLERLLEAERRTETLQSDMKRLEEQLAKETLARRSVEAELEEVRVRRSVSSLHAGEGERASPGGEKHWASTVAHLRSQLQQEQLRVRLLEAGEQENSARVLALQRDVRDTLEANHQLQAKYNQVRAAYKAKRAEKSRQRELSQLYTAQVKELGKTSAALEENFKAMLSALGESIEVTVELLASHVFLTPCLVHPGPTLHHDPETWFGAQQGRLRWLQAQLRKLCLHNWKTGNLPRTSNLDSSYFDLPLKETQSFLIAGKAQIKEEVQQRQRQAPRPSRMQLSGVKGDILSELSILEGRSYTSTPVRRRSSPSDISFSAASSPTKFGGEAKHETPKPLPQTGETKINMTPHKSTLTSGLHSQGAHSSVYLSEAEHILISQQKELSAAKYRQYKALIHSLQQGADQSMIPSPSIPSSVFTTPEWKGIKLSQNPMEENDNDSLNSEGSLAEIRCCRAVSPTSVSSSASESSTSTHSLSGISVRDILHTPKETQRSQIHEEEMNLNNMTSPKIEDSSHKLPEQDNALNIEQSSRSSSRCSVVKSHIEEGVNGVRERDVQQVKDSLKEDQQSHCLDVDKDRDSWEQEPEEDLIRALVYSEAAGP